MHENDELLALLAQPHAGVAVPRTSTAASDTAEVVPIDQLCVAALHPRRGFILPGR